MNEMRFVARLCRSESGQDLVEYTLLLAFLLLASVALYIDVNSTINQLWLAISRRLAS